MVKGLDRFKEHFAVDEEIFSLSAILMNGDYYDFVMERRTTMDGLSLVKADGLRWR